MNSERTSAWSCLVRAAIFDDFKYSSAATAMGDGFLPNSCSSSLFTLALATWISLRNDC